MLLILSVAGCTTGAIGTAVGSPQAEARPAAALQAGSDSNPRTVSVSGSGTASAAPDVAYVQLGVEVINPDATQAVQDSTDRMTAVMDALKELGIADKNIQTVQYNISVEQQRDQQGQPTGEIRYHVNNRIRVTVDDISQVGDLLQKTLAAGANTVDSINFSIKDPEALQQQARDAAIADAKAKAEQLATGFDAQLGPVYQINESGGGVPRPQAEAPVMMQASGAVPVSGGELNISVDIQVTFELQ